MKSSQNCMYHMPWVNSRTNSAKYFIGESVIIDASPAAVWKIVKDIENYAIYSHGKITAHVEGKLEVNKTISLQLYKDQTIGKFFPISHERVSVVDDEHKIIGWERVLPGGGVTERYQILEESKDGKTHSHIALKIPGAVGFFTSLTLRTWINNAFTEINLGFKEAAEKKIEKTYIK